MCVYIFIHICIYIFYSVSSWVTEVCRTVCFCVNGSKLLCFVNYALVSSYSPCFKQPVSNLAAFNVPASSTIQYLFISQLLFAAFNLLWSRKKDNDRF